MTLPTKEEQAATQPDLLGLRDRALIAMMVYSFARIAPSFRGRLATILSRGAAVGCVYTKKVARSMTFPVIIVSINVCTTISMRPASPMTSTAISSAAPAARPAS